MMALLLVVCLTLGVTMRLEQTEFSCGVGELAGLAGQTPEQIVAYIADYGMEQPETGDCECDCEACQKCENKGEGHCRFAFIIWSDLAAAMSPGSRLARYLTRKYRGTVTATAAKVNPNTKNTIKVWTFIPSPAFIAWANKQ